MKMFPDASSVMPLGPPRLYLVAIVALWGFPIHLTSVPAIVVIIPVLAVTKRILLFNVSAMKMLPDVSTAASLGEDNAVLVAATLSPE